jgi:hypothetical protein
MDLLELATERGIADNRRGDAPMSDGITRVLLGLSAVAAFVALPGDLARARTNDDHSRRKSAPESDRHAATSKEPVHRHGHNPPAADSGDLAKHRGAHHESADDVDHRSFVAKHGGVVASANRYHFEVVVTPAGVGVYSYGPDGQAIPADQLSGTVTFYHPNSRNPWFSRALGLAAADCGQPAPPLQLEMNLRAVPRKGARVAIEIAGLPGADGPVGPLTLPLKLQDRSEIPTEDLHRPNR